MQLLALVSPVLGTNCYILSRDGGEECVVVDPGIGIEEELETTFAEHSLRPVAALVTHGHLDHTFSLSPLCSRRELPVYIHEADVYRLHDPLGSLGPELAGAFAGLADGWTPPPDVRAVQDGQVIDDAGLNVRVIHAPGHTEGSVLYFAPTAGPDGQDVMFTGDVVFAGTVGRTDLPGGDPVAMQRTLENIARLEADGGLPDATAILPGHNEADALGNQRATNPFLRNIRGNL